MSMEPVDPAEPEVEPVAATAPERTGGGWTLVTLIAHDGQEPPANLPDGAALAAWCAVSAPWHPSLLAHADALPRIEDVDDPTPPGPNEVRVFAEGTANRLPSGYQTQAEDAGTLLIEGGSDRQALVREIQGRMGLEDAPGREEAAAIAVALDFHALGTARWWLRDLTIAMGHADMLDAESLTREVLSGATAWQSGDDPAATNRLR